MQTRWFSFRSAEQTFIQNKKNKTPCSFLIHFTVADTMAPPVNGPFERLAPLTVHRIQKHMDLAKPGYRDGWANVTPSDLCTLNKSDWWPLLRRSSVFIQVDWRLLEDCLPLCQPAYWAPHGFGEACNSRRMREANWNPDSRRVDAQTGSELICSSTGQIVPHILICQTKK